MKKIYTIIVGGKAGDGVKKSVQVLAKLLLKHSYHIFQQDDYQSLIRGGHSFSTVSFSLDPVYCAYKHADLLISFDQRSMKAHEFDLKPEALHCYNADDSAETSLPNAHGFPLSSLMKQIYGKPVNVSMAAIALFYRWMGWDAEDMEHTIRQEFKHDIDDNVLYAKEVWKLTADSLTDSAFKDAALMPQAAKSARLISGNQAIALGAWAAGLDFYYAYPMTPASSILHYLALKQGSHKVYAIHAESEIAAANMAIGSVFAGAKTAIGSSGGGFALMQEAFSLAGMVEAPLLCILSSRPGPATGVSTYTGQEDLAFALSQGHGEFGRIVAAPDSLGKGFSLAAELLYLAWEYQSPVILLTDKQLSESATGIGDFPETPTADAITSDLPDELAYERYAITESGVSPLLYPGEGNVEDYTVIKWNSIEHTPGGTRTDDAGDIVTMKDKRKRKAIGLHEATKAYQRIAVYGDSGMPVYAYGSTVLELREAQKHCKTPFRIIALIYLLPLPKEELSAYLDEEAIVVEHSSTGFLATYLSQNLQLKVKDTILRYDGRPFDPYELATILEGVLNA